MAVSIKTYVCSECGTSKKIDTNHFGPCYSYGRVNVCPACPPFKKYPEFGGGTKWLCREHLETFNYVRTFDNKLFKIRLITTSVDFANKFCEENPDCGVIMERFGKIYVAEVKETTLEQFEQANYDFIVKLGVSI